MSSGRIHLEYLENLNVLSVLITFKNSFREISFNKFGINLVDESNVDYKITFDSISIDPASAANVYVKKINDAQEASFRFKVTEYKSQIRDSSKDLKENEIDSILSLRCLSCFKELSCLNNEKFKVLAMPDNELEELEDNFWCHNHEHSHDHDESPEAHEHEDKYKSKKSILFNNTTLLVNKNHVDLNNLIISSDQVMIKCFDCNYKIGFKNRKHSDYVYLWRSDVLIDNTLKFDLFSLLKPGRYIIEVKNGDKKTFIFIHVLTCKLLYSCIDLKSMILSDNKAYFERNWKKLLYKIYDPKSDLELRNKWFNDINVEFIAISYDFYLKTLKRLVESTQTLPESQRKSKNGFFLAVM